MKNHTFVYVSYIKTSVDTLWSALTSTEFTRQYWKKMIKSDWKVGSPVQLLKEDGTMTVHGKILAIDKPKLLSYSWIMTSDELREEPSTVTFELEPRQDAIKLTVTHDRFPENSKVVGPISEGWPFVLSALKSLLETKQPISDESFGCK